MRFGNKNEGELVDYQIRARTLVRNHVNEFATNSNVASLDDVYIVWFSKTLQNWKALVSTTIPDDRYYEVTYDGDKCQAYLDVYLKIHNVVIPDAE